jgi:hypothetical protein
MYKSKLKFKHKKYLNIFLSNSDGFCVTGYTGISNASETPIWRLDNPQVDFINNRISHIDKIRHQHNQQ